MERNLIRNFHFQVFIESNLKSYKVRSPALTHTQARILFLLSVATMIAFGIREQKIIFSSDVVFELKHIIWMMT